MGIIESGIVGMNFLLRIIIFILVYNKTFLKTISMQTSFDEMQYIVEYLILNIFSFLIIIE